MNRKKNNLTKDQLIEQYKQRSLRNVVWAQRLLQIGISLSHEKNILKLLEMILYESRKFTNCDAGTFYRLSKNKKFLNFTVMHNDTMKEYSGGTSGITPSLPAVPLFDEKGKPSNILLSKEKWLVSLEFELTESLPSVVATIAPVTSEGVTISAIWSKPKDLQPGIYSVNYEIELPLAACQLSFIVGLSSRGQTIYYKENIGSVTITEISGGQQPEYRPKGHGLFITDNQPEIIYEKKLIK